jgi:hypothetical protein
VRQPITRCLEELQDFRRRVFPYDFLPGWAFRFLGQCSVGRPRWTDQSLKLRVAQPPGVGCCLLYSNSPWGSQRRRFIVNGEKMFYKVRNKLNYAYFRYRTRGIMQSPPIGCSLSAPCDVHTMLGAQDAPLYLVAIKSLLRFYSGVSVVIHSDGTLDANWESTFRRHLPGCAIVFPAEAEERATRELGRDSYLFQSRNLDINYRRLIDTELWSGRKKKIIMDSDILVVRPPLEVISWIEQGELPWLMGEPLSSNAGTLRGGADHVQTVFQEKLGEISAAMGLPALFLDGGTGGFYGSSGEMTRDRIEQLIKASLQAGVPLNRWGSDQCLIIYLLSAAGARRLNTDRYLNFRPTDLGRLDRAEVLHFYGTYRFYKRVYTRVAAQAVAALSSRPACADGALPPVRPSIGAPL